MAKQTDNLITIRDGLWAVMLGYGMDRKDAQLQGRPVPARAQWITKWMVQNLPRLAPDFRHHALKIIKASGSHSEVSVAGMLKKVSAVEFIIDSLFALDHSVNELPIYAVRIPRTWVAQVRKQSEAALAGRPLRH